MVTDRGDQIVMIGLLKKKAGPIGIDLGCSSIKMVQLSSAGEGVALVAAARAQVPWEVQGNREALQHWYVKTTKQLLASKPFRGRKVVTCLPGDQLMVQHHRLPKMDNDRLGDAVANHAREHIAIDLEHGLLRHIVAGEVYEGDKSRLEVILMAAAGRVLRQHLVWIERSRLDIQAIDVAPCALVKSFAAALQQDPKGPQATMFVNIEPGVTNVVVARATQIRFARTLQGVGKQACVRKPVENGGGANNAAAFAENAERSAAVQSLANELRSCIRYHDTVFESEPVRKIVFLGGWATKRYFCLKLAQAVGLPAQLGDPLVRIAEKTRIGAHSDLKADQSNSEWAVAFGLGLGGLTVSAKDKATTDTGAVAGVAAAKVATAAATTTTTKAALESKKQAG